MNVDGLSQEELDRRLAELLEPEPVYVHDVKQIVMAHMYGPPLRSPKGAWECICVYDDGDEPRWVPREFSSDWAAMGSLLEQMQERELYVHLSTVTLEYYCVFARRPLDLRQDPICIVHSYSLVEAVARAACKALEEEAETKVTA